MSENKQGYWWCPRCDKPVDSMAVTYEECHSGCGGPVEWIEPMEPVDELRRQLAAANARAEKAEAEALNPSCTRGAVGEEWCKCKACRQAMRTRAEKAEAACAEYSVRDIHWCNLLKYMKDTAVPRLHHLERNALGQRADMPAGKEALRWIEQALRIDADRIDDGPMRANLGQPILDELARLRDWVNCLASVVEQLLAAHEGPTAPLYERAAKLMEQALAEAKVRP